MEMKNYIEKAEKKAGSQTKLAEMLDITASYIRNVKAGKRGFSTEMCILLADYIGEDRLEVIAASGLVTEKDERKRKILESCFKKVAGFAAIAVVTTILTTPFSKPVNAGDFSSNLQKYKLYAIGL